MSDDGYGFYLNRAMDVAAAPVATPGGSGYFSTPSPELDPRLFNGTVFRPEVRGWILDTLYTYWRTRFHSPESWSTVWAAGSGITYQWSASRSNGDLDILIGVDYPAFFAANEGYQGLTQADLSQVFNDDLREHLWPNTSQKVFGSPPAFEVTFFVNIGATDIRDINPYAAYNLTTNTWTVHPPVLPQDPKSLYPKSFYAAFDKERDQANVLLDRYRTIKSQTDAMAPGTPGWVNSVGKAGLVIDQARALFDSIHLGRHNAFGPGGSGYGDYYNFRWQAHKQAGTMQALHDVAELRSTAREAYEKNLYGGPIKSAEDSLIEASLWNTPGYARRPA
jgi:hypothetical protein